MSFSAKLFFLLSFLSDVEIELRLFSYEKHKHGFQSESKHKPMHYGSFFLTYIFLKGLEHGLGFLGIFYGKVLKTADLNDKSAKYNLQYNFSISTKCKFDALSFFKVTNY